MMDDEDRIIRVCHGGPCPVNALKDNYLLDGRAVDRGTYMRACRLCQQIVMRPDGSETVIDVARA